MSESEQQPAAALRLRALPPKLRRVLPGLILAGVIAIAARYLSEHYGGPAMLFALLLGMAFHYLSENDRAGPGIMLSSRHILRIGVALLGVRVTWGEIGDLGIEVVVLVVGSVALTIVIGALIGRALGLTRDHAILSAGAVAICGASAALAIASVLPRHERSEHNTILTVVGVTTLSTLAMMVYPLISALFAFSDQAAGVFIGATIHDVAQVVGAGYTISAEAGDTAAVVKLLRVACLTPVVIIIGFSMRTRQKVGASPAPLIPGFLVAFILLVALNSFGVIGGGLRDVMSDASQWCLLTAVAALGVRTSLEKLTAVGPKPLLALGFQTLFLAAIVIAALFALAF